MSRKITIVTLAMSVVLTFIAALYVFWTLALSWVTSGDIPHRSDEELIDNFHSHKAEFNQLLQTVRADEGLKRVDDNWTSPKDPQTVGVSQERIGEYRRLFHKLRIPRGFSAFQTKDHVRFIASTQGLGISGSAKGYVYAKRPPELVVDNLDGYRSKDGRSFTAYRHIEGDWYLFFEYTD